MQEGLADGGRFVEGGLTVVLQCSALVLFT